VIKSITAIVKDCGLKSTNQVAELNGVTRQTISNAYRKDRTRFEFLVLEALAIDFKNKAIKAERVLNETR